MSCHLLASHKCSKLLMMMMKGLAEEARIFVQTVLVLFSWENLHNDKADESGLSIISDWDGGERIKRVPFVLTTGSQYTLIA